MTGTQPFPEGARTGPGSCLGAFCQGAAATVVPCLVGPTYRTSRRLDLCADCLADFAVMNSAIPEGVAVNVVEFDPATGVASAVKIPRFRVWAQGEDGLYHEVEGNIP